MPITNGLGLSGQYDDPEWPRYVRTTDIRDSRSLRDDVFASQPPEVARAAMLKRGDILMTAAGATIGKSVTFDEDYEACYAGFLARFRPGPSVDGRFVSFWMQSQDYWDQVQANAVRSTIDNFSGSKYRALRIPLPPLAEQRRIANYLDDQTTRIDQTIQLRQKQQQALTEWSASSWKEAADELVDAYGAIPLRRVLSSITDGPFGSSLKSTHYSDSGVRVIRLGNIGLGEFRNGDEAFIDEAYAAELSEHSVMAGDLVVAGLGDDRWPLGRATVIPASVGPAIVKADCYRVRLRPMVLHGFAAWFLSSPVGGACFNLLARGSTRQRLNTDVVRDVLLPVPPLSVQVNALRDWESRHRFISEAHRTFDDSIRLLMERRRSLITAAVSGELDVSSASSRTADVVVSGMGGGL